MRCRLRDITTATGNLRLDAALRQVELFETEEFTGVKQPTPAEMQETIDEDLPF